MSSLSSGYDHNMCVNGARDSGADSDELRFVCRVEHAGKGRVLECRTNQPGVQFYTGQTILISFIAGFKLLGNVEEFDIYVMYSRFCQRYWNVKRTTMKSMIKIRSIAASQKNIVNDLHVGNFLPTDGSLVGKGGAVYGKQGAFCLETQNFPDAINQPNFPDCILAPGKVYQHKTRYKWDITADKCFVVHVTIFFLYRFSFLKA